MLLCAKLSFDVFSSAETELKVVEVVCRGRERRVVERRFSGLPFGSGLKVPLIGICSGVDLSNERTVPISEKGCRPDFFFVTEYDFIGFYETKKRIWTSFVLLLCSAQNGFQFFMCRVISAPPEKSISWSSSNLHLIAMLRLDLIFSDQAGKGSSRQITKATNEFFMAWVGLSDVLFHKFEPRISIDTTGSRTRPTRPTRL